AECDRPGSTAASPAGSLDTQRSRGNIESLSSPYLGAIVRCEHLRRALHSGALSNLKRARSSMSRRSLLPIAVRYRLQSQSAFPFAARPMNALHRYGLAAAGDKHRRPRPCSIALQVAVNSAEALSSPG